MHVGIVKHGALGDVVRTAYFAPALRRCFGPNLRLSWVTSSVSAPLLRFHDAIDDLWTDFDVARQTRFDWVISLDDEPEIIDGVMSLAFDRLTGALRTPTGTASYSADSAEWFDMGLLSRYGKTEADRRKRENSASHAEIFAGMLGVAVPQPSFHGHPRLEAWARSHYEGHGLRVGINPFAGGRWASKELRPVPLEELSRALLADSRMQCEGSRLLLFGAGGDRLRNLELARRLNDPRVLVPDTDDSVLRLAATIRVLDYLITSDSLAMHLAIAQEVPVLAFFSPTSAAEIDTFGRGVKVRSLAPDYCSYRKDADNSTITSERLLAAMHGHWGELKLGRPSRPA